MNNVGKGELISSQLVVLVSVKKHQNVEIPARVTAKLFSKKLQNIMMLFFSFLLLFISDSYFESSGLYRTDSRRKQD